MVNAEIIKVESDENNNIKVTTRYTDDSGTVLQDGVTRYSLAVLPTLDEIEALLHSDIEHHCQALIGRAFSASLKDGAEERNLNSIDDLKTRVIGVKKQVLTADLKVGKLNITVDNAGTVLNKALDA